MTLAELLEWARGYKMTPEQETEQIKSFAYGNVKLSNDAITKADIDKAYEDLWGKNESHNHRT